MTESPDKLDFTKLPAEDIHVWVETLSEPTPEETAYFNKVMGRMMEEVLGRPLHTPEELEAIRQRRIERYLSEQSNESSC